MSTAACVPTAPTSDRAGGGHHDTRHRKRRSPADRSTAKQRAPRARLQVAPGSGHPTREPHLSSSGGAHRRRGRGFSASPTDFRSRLERAFSAVLRVRPQLCDATALDPAWSCPTQTGDRVGDHSNQRVDDAERAANEAPASSPLRWPGTVPIAVLVSLHLLRVRGLDRARGLAVADQCRAGFGAGFSPRTGGSREPASTTCARACRRR
jgi:hypothetical protein